jgi:triacylglycerol esterase/lipase EstA (alpha/beta hydrolase family)
MLNRRSSTFPAVRSDANEATKRFSAARTILNFAGDTPQQAKPSKDASLKAAKVREIADQLVKLLETGVDQTNAQKIDAVAHSLGLECLSIAKLTLAARRKV